MVYHPDGSGRDMYVLGPRNSNGPQLIDVAMRDTSRMNRAITDQIRNASRYRNDNKIPSKIEDYEMKAIVTRSIAERSRSAAEAGTLAAAKLTLATLTETSSNSTRGGINGNNGSLYNTTLQNTVNMNNAVRNASYRSASGLMVASGGCISPMRFNNGVQAGGNSPLSETVTRRHVHVGAANSYFADCQRSTSGYVSPKMPSTPESPTGRVGGTAHQQAMATAATVASLQRSRLDLSTTRDRSDVVAEGLSGTSNGGAQTSRVPARTNPNEGSVLRPVTGGGHSATRRAPSAGFNYNRHIYESTAEKGRRTGLSFQPYEAPMQRSVLPEVRAKYSNM